jgi:Kdo2-lipid IVA lauroyltransferase/acyltransferase
MTERDPLAGRILLVLMLGMSFLPLSFSQAIGRTVGRMIRLFDTRAARVTRTNLEICMPELSASDRAQLMKESLEHTGATLMETPAAWLGAQGRVRRWIRCVENQSLLDDAIALGDGVIILLPHIGNWELINVYLAAEGKTVTGLYAPPNQPYLKPLMSRIRSRFGNELVPTTIKGIATLYRRLQEGRVVVILPDQVPATGAFAPFFGVPALTDTLITRLLRRQSARVVGCVIKRRSDGDGFDLIFVAPHADIYHADASIALRGMNLTVEACVALAPAQYQWEYKRFKERPSGERRLYNYNNEPSTHHE